MPRSLTMLVEHGVDLDAVDYSGFAALHWAAMRGRLEDINLLLASGADPHVAGPQGGTPLHFVGGRDRVAECIDALVEAGVDIDVTDLDGRTPLDWALDTYDESVVAALQRE